MIIIQNIWINSKYKKDYLYSNLNLKIYVITLVNSAHVSS
jgi:hypothetical protein